MTNATSLSLHTYSTQDQLDTTISGLLFRNILTSDIDRIMNATNAIGEEFDKLIDPLIEKGLHVAFFQEWLEGPVVMPEIRHVDHGDLLALKYRIRWTLFDDTDSVCETPEATLHYLIKKATLRQEGKWSTFDIVDVVQPLP